MKKMCFWWVMCFGLLLWSFFQMYSYAVYTNEPYAWDQSAHLMISILQNNLLKEGKILEALRFYDFYPPLAHLTYIPLMNWYGLTRMSVTLHQYGWLFVFFVSVMWLGFGVVSHQTQSILFLVCLTLLTASGIHHINVWDPMLEIPLAISITIFYLFCYRIYIKKTYSLISTISLCFLISVVLLIKGSGGIHLVIPLVFYWFQMIKKFKFKTVGYFILFFGIFYILNDWYRINFDLLREDAWDVNVFKGVVVKHDPQGLAGAWRYIKAIGRSLGVLAVVPVVIWFKRLLELKHFVWKKSSGELVLWLSLLVAFFVLVLSPNKDDRYIFIWTVPAMAVSIITNSELFNKKASMLLLGITMGIFVWRTITVMPSISHKKYIANDLHRILEKYQIQHLNIFFEDDSEKFNYANLALMNLTTLPIPYTSLNHNSFDLLIEHDGKCEVNPKSNYVLVYANGLNQLQRPDYHVSFAEYCNNFDVSSACQLIEEIRPNDDEQLSIYYCRS